MPLVNEAYWRDRFGQASPCWSGTKWLDWEHGIICRHAFRRVLKGVFPGGESLPLGRLGTRVIDVGCGDGSWTRWMINEFGFHAHGVDALEWPDVRDRISFTLADAEAVDRVEQLVRWDADLVVYMNSLTCVADWRAAVKAGMNLAPRVLCFDNFQTPTPAYWKNLPHRKPIQVFDLAEEFLNNGYEIEDAVTADWFHRKLFLLTPQFTHPVVAGVSAALDLAAAHVLPAGRARHSAILFKRVEEAK